LPESMAGTLDVLVRLQEKDLQLRKLIEARSSIPRAIEEQERELREEKEKLAEKDRALAELKKRRRGREKDLEELEESISSKQKQLLKVTNNKEYKALLGEIETARELQSRAESDLLGLMEDEEKLVEETERAGRELEPKVREIEQAKAELREEMQRIEAQIPELERERARIAESLDPGVRSRYEKIANGKGGLAVVPVRKGACGGCFTTLPAQRVNEIKRNDSLIACESCGRLLVWNNESHEKGGES